MNDQEREHNRTRDTGGHVFPHPSYVNARGMVLRDYFAAKAMQTVMANSGGYWHQDSLAVYAETAYKMADAMLKARDA